MRYELKQKCVARRLCGTESQKAGSQRGRGAPTIRAKPLIFLRTCPFQVVWDGSAESRQLTRVGGLLMRYELVNRLYFCVSFAGCVGRLRRKQAVDEGGSETGSRSPTIGQTVSVK